MRADGRYEAGADPALGLGLLPLLGPSFGEGGVVGTREKYPSSRSLVGERDEGDNVGVLRGRTKGIGIAWDKEDKDEDDVSPTISYAFRPSTTCSVGMCVCRLTNIGGMSFVKITVIAWFSM